MLDVDQRSHVPVLLKETIDLLAPLPGALYIDATFGEGGHTFPILEKIRPGGKVLAIDADLDAVRKSPKQSASSADAMRQAGIKGLTLVHGNFAELRALAEECGFAQVHGVLFDLGLSSTQLDDAARGFSFQAPGPLDMRFDRSQKRTAADLINTASGQELARLFKNFGEEKFSERIARSVVRQRRIEKIATTADLFSQIKSALPKAYRHKVSDAARRIFQAIRIAVNGELENLKLALPQAFELLRPQGRLAVISFHSLEDRIVKQYFALLARGCKCPPEFPQCVCGRKPEAKILTRKPIIPSEEETARNSRARSAKLRAVTKL